MGWVEMLEQKVWKRLATKYVRDGLFGHVLNNWTRSRSGNSKETNETIDTTTRKTKDELQESLEIEREGIMTATGDDGRILAKIIEVAFVPISPALAHQITGDVNQYVIRDVGKTLNQGFAAFAAPIRLMAKDDIMEMVNDLFELVLNGTEHFVNREARCLGSFEKKRKKNGRKADSLGDGRKREGRSANSVSCTAGRACWAGTRNSATPRFPSFCWYIRNGVCDAGANRPPP